jgi:putative oxidoreductase
MTRAHWISTLSRIFCGLVFFFHGTPKILNLEGTRTFFENVGVPGALALPIAVLEFGGGILLAAGLLTRVLAWLFIAEMFVAGLLVHVSSGWDVFEGGFEYNIALILLLLTVVLFGSGPISVDNVIGLRREKATSPKPGEATIR